MIISYSFPNVITIFLTRRFNYLRFSHQYVKIILKLTINCLTITIDFVLWSEKSSEIDIYTNIHPDKCFHGSCLHCWRVLIFWLFGCKN